MQLPIAWILLGSLAWTGQALELLEQAPPHIDQALRERVRLFYQAHVDGKFRMADTVVHEDSKDAFFAAEKRRYKSFEILKIQYSENFTRARVTVVVDSEFQMPGAGQIPVKIPLTSLWKYDQGQWWWYVEPPEKTQETPFGLMRPGMGSEQTASVFPRQLPSPEELRKQVQIDKSQARLKANSDSEDRIVVTNRTPGLVKVSLHGPKLPGLEASIDKPNLQAGEQATISFRYRPSGEAPKRPLRVELQIEPLELLIPVEVVFEHTEAGQGTSLPSPK